MKPNVIFVKTPMLISTGFAILKYHNAINMILMQNVLNVSQASIYPMVIVIAKFKIARVRKMEVVLNVMFHTNYPMMDKHVT
jgi:hypothetical protein